MEKEDKLKVRGTVELKVLRATGETYTRKFKNLVGNHGTSLLANLLSGGVGQLISHIALGTDSVPPPAATDTTLVDEIFRQSCSTTLLTGPDANKVEYQASWLAGAAQGSLQEAGLFDTDTGGNMFSRTTFTQLDIGPADTLIVTWQIEFVGV